MAFLRAAGQRFVAFGALMGTVILASLMWMALSALVLPLPAATAALFHTVVRALRGEGENPFADFPAGLRRYWRSASLVGFPGLILGLVLGVDAAYFLTQPGLVLNAVGALFLSAFGLWLAIWLTFWPAFVLRDAGWKQQLRDSFWLAMARLPWSVAAVTVTAMLVASSAVTPFLIPFVPGLIALTASWGALRTFRHYGLIKEVKP